jgi:phasin
MTEPVSAPDHAEPVKAIETAVFHDETRPLSQPADPLEIAEAFPEQIMEARDIIAQSVELTVGEARTASDRIRKAADEATSGVEGVLAAAGSGFAEFNLKAIEAVKASTDAMFDFARAMAGARTMSQVVELQTEHVRRQFEAANTQAKEFAELASRVSARAMAPLGDTIGKAFGQPS